MAGNGRRRSRRPRIESITPAARDSEAAAIVAALERFEAETAAPAMPPGPVASPWQRAALEEGVTARQVSGAVWGQTG